jgi:hypothetical protein
MHRRVFLHAVLAGSALPLCTALLGVARADADPALWHGFAKAQGAYVRAAPTRAAEIRAELQPGDAVEIDRWVAGAELYPTLVTWGHLADGSGYVYGSTVRIRMPDGPPAPPAEAATWTEDWIDVNLTQNVVTAYAGQNAEAMFPTSPGRPGWETTHGLHRVRSQARVQDMAGPGYYVRGVQFISYFVSWGEALHARTWDLDAISLGVPSSHGCLGLGIDAAAFIYGFATPGTRVYVHD